MFVVLAFQWGDEDPVDCYGPYDDKETAEEYAKLLTDTLADREEEIGWCNFMPMEINPSPILLS